MLFNSYVFIFAFLPITFVAYFYIARYKSGEAAIVFLVIASLFFYGWWNPIYLMLILCSMGVNYFVGEIIIRSRSAKKLQKAKLLLAFGIIFNLGLLGYFKYAYFLALNMDMLFGFDIQLSQIILPLAISFFTFQQITYLVDAFKGITEEFKFTHYALFVTFFPQLIAGPIVHHKEMLPQFLKLENIKPRLENVVIGLSFFALGLFKKVVLADGISQYSTPVFDAATMGDAITLFIAWGGSLAYTFQLYFDFSGYSDMAIGIAMIFGIRLPLNFASPYKSINIIEFWRRWHMTLSRFLRDYVYIALGGNRKGKMRRYSNLLTTMLLGGLWHGAGWTFVFWGGLHGLYLIINHSWRYVIRKLKLEFLEQLLVWRFLCWFLTFICVVNAWVFFRATTFDSAIEILKGMYGFNGISLPNAICARLGNFSNTLSWFGVTTFLGGGSQFIFTYLWVATLLLISLMMPNTQQVMKSFFSFKRQQGGILFGEGVLSRLLVFQYSMVWAFIMALVLVIAIFGLTRVSEFLYFQF